MQRNNQIVIFFLLAVTSCVLISSSYADPSACGDLGEGWFQKSPPTAPGGIYGANRHIYSAAGYGHVSGTLHIPSEMHVYLKPDPANPGVMTNPHGNKPTLYLGVKGSGYEIDSGLVYEPVKINKLDPGWSVFTNASVGSCGEWTQSTNSSNRRALSSGQTLTTAFFLNLTGKMYLNLQGFPSTVVDIFPTSDKTASPTGMMIKRNIGITQGDLLKIDGSFMHGAGFSKGEVQKWIKNDKGEWVLDAPNPWPISGSIFDYIPMSRNEGLTYQDGPLKGTPKYQVDSEGWWRRTYANSEGSHTPSRYQEEYVDVDLLVSLVHVR